MIAGRAARCDGEVVVLALAGRLAAAGRHQVAQQGLHLPRRGHPACLQFVPASYYFREAELAREAAGVAKGVDPIVSEVAQRTLASLKEHHQTLTACFRNFDKDLDNTITLQEMRRGFETQARIALTDRDARSLFAAFDRDGSGEVDLHEMLAAFRALDRDERYREEQARRGAAPVVWFPGLVSFTDTVAPKPQLAECAIL